MCSVPLPWPCLQVLTRDALMPDAFVHEVSSSVKLLQTLWRGCGELVGKLGAAFPEQRKLVQVELTRMYTQAGNLAIEMQQSYVQGGGQRGDTWECVPAAYVPAAYVPAACARSMCPQHDASAADLYLAALGHGAASCTAARTWCLQMRSPLHVHSGLAPACHAPPAFSTQWLQATAPHCTASHTDDGSSDEEARSYSGWAAPPVAAMSREVLRSMAHQAVTDEEVQCQAWVPGLLLSLLHRGQEAYKHLRDLLVEEEEEDEGPQVGTGLGCCE
jgi:hypothetical protein